jgi:hypothetical protein
VDDDARVRAVAFEDGRRGVSFLRRILEGRGRTEPDGAVADDSTAPPTASDLEADERAHELDVLRAEQDRLDDLRRRQLRYADRAWTPPAQGGERRADDVDSEGSDSGS